MKTSFFTHIDLNSEHFINHMNFREGETELRVKEGKRPGC